MFIFEDGKYIIEVPIKVHRFIQDVVKYVLILSVYHIMLYSKDGKSSSASLYAEQCIYIILGLAVYWLIYDKFLYMKPI